VHPKSIANAKNVPTVVFKNVFLMFFSSFI